MLNGSCLLLLWYLRATTDQIRDTDRTSRVHLMMRMILPETRIESLILLLLLLVAVDLLLAPLDTTEVRLGGRGLVPMMMSTVFINGRARGLMPAHETSL